MADDETGKFSVPVDDSSGSRDRATVALVDAKVDGVRELVRAEFASVKEDIRALGGLMADVIKMGVMLDNHEKRIVRLEEGNAGFDHEKRLKRIEDREADERLFRRERLPALVISAIAATIGIVGVLISLHVI